MFEPSTFRTVEPRLHSSNNLVFNVSYIIMISWSHIFTLGKVMDISYTTPAFCVHHLEITNTLLTRATALHQRHNFYGARRVCTMPLKMPHQSVSLHTNQRAPIARIDCISATRGGICARVASSTSRVYSNWDFPCGLDIAVTCLHAWAPNPPPPPHSLTTSPPHCCHECGHIDRRRVINDLLSSLTPTVVNVWPRYGL